jgi:hypothetical protein
MPRWPWPITDAIDIHALAQKLERVRYLSRDERRFVIDLILTHGDSELSNAEMKERRDRLITEFVICREERDSIKTTAAVAEACEIFALQERQIKYILAEWRPKMGYLKRAFSSPQVRRAIDLMRNVQAEEEQLVKDLSGRT